MSCRNRVFTALLLISLTGGVFARAQEQPDKNSDAADKQQEAAPKKDQPPTKDNKKGEEKKPDMIVSVPLKISAEGKPALPSGASLEWQGLTKGCSDVTGKKNLNSEGITLVNLPACTVKLVIFITGFDTKTVTLDIGKDRDKNKDPIRILVKHQGPPQVGD